MASGIIENVNTEHENPGEAPVLRWAPLAGRWTFDSNNARYEGPAEGAVGANRLSYGLARCGINLPDGKVRCTICLSRNERTSAGIVFGFHSLHQPYSLFQLGAWDSAYSIGEYVPDFGWQKIAAAGSIRNLEPIVPYEIEVSVQGQRIRASVNEVDVLDAVLRTPLSSGGVGMFAWDDAPIDFANVRIETDQLRVFVVMPFEEPFDTLYRDVIRPVAADELGMDVKRVDDVSGPGIILDDIRQQIEEAHAIVAEISTGNPNVFYELGYAHALNKPAILLRRRDPEKRMPFDIQGYRAIFYDDSIGGKKQVEAHLRKHLEALKRDL